MNIVRKACNDQETRGRVLYYSSPPSLAQRMPQWIQECGYEIDVVTTWRGILDTTAEIIVLDLNESPNGGAGSRCLCNEDISQMARHGLDTNRPAQVILLTSDSTPLPEINRFYADDCVADVFVGVFERPRNREILNTLLRNAMQRSRVFEENRRLRWQLSNQCLRDVLGESHAIHQLLCHTQQAANSDRHVLICGERGTRKDLLARAIHQGSHRSHADFLQWDCRTMSSRLLERELFSEDSPTSHGGVSKPTGYLDSTTQWHLVLSEIDHMSLPLQRRLGRHLHRMARPSAVDASGVRVIATTTCRSEEIVHRRGLSPQLYQQFKDHIIQTPALRDRPSDIEALATHFLDAWSLESGLPIKQIAPDAMQILKRYPWPGNVRELQQVIQYACAMEVSYWITSESIQPLLCGTGNGPDGESSGISLKEMERKLIETTFNRYSGNRERTARTLKIGVRTLSGKLREYGYPPRGGPGSNRKAA